MTTMASLLRGLSPWSAAESLRAAVLVGAGAVTLMVAWNVASREAVWSSQTPAVGFGIVGFIVGAHGAVSWLQRARLAVMRRRRALLPDWNGQLGIAVEGARHVVAHPERGRYHRPSCALAQGRGWPQVDTSALAAGGREPCGVCQP